VGLAREGARARLTKLVRAVDHAGHFNRPPMPWRAATLVLAAVAVVELAGLLALGGARLRPHLHLPRRTAAPAAKAAHAPARGTATHRTAPKPAAPRLRPARPVSRVSVLVLNGNGVTGAAGAEARQLRAEGYRSAIAADATRSNYATTLVLFAPGYEAEGRRLGRELGTRLVSPLDGTTTAQLRGSQLVAILGGS
jgi:hypothetical protein